MTAAHNDAPKKTRRDRDHTRTCPPLCGHRDGRRLPRGQAVAFVRWAAIRGHRWLDDGAPGPCRDLAPHGGLASMMARPSHYLEDKVE